MIINMNGMGTGGSGTVSPVLQSKTVTPESLPVVIGPDAGYNGLSQVTINRDSQLKAENIRSGKTIFGVSGTFEGTTAGTTDWDPSMLADMPGNYTFFNPSHAFPDITLVTESVPYTGCHLPNYSDFIFSYNNVLFKSCHEQDPRYLTCTNNSGSSVGLHVVKTIKAGTYTFEISLPSNMVNVRSLKKLKFEHGTIVFATGSNRALVAAPTIKMTGVYEFDLTPTSISTATIEVDIPETVVDGYAPITSDYEVGKEETTSMRMTLYLRKAIFY